MAFRSLPVAALPTVDYPTIQVAAGLPGASPETMASSVATPLESQFSTIAGMESDELPELQGWTQVNVQFTLSAKHRRGRAGRPIRHRKADGLLPPTCPTRLGIRRRIPPISRYCIYR